MWIVAHLQLFACSLILLHLLAWHVTRPFLQRDPRLLKLKVYIRIKLLTKFSGSFNEGNLLGEPFFCGEPFTAPSGQASDEPTTSVDTEASEIKMACMVQTLCSDVFGIGGREPSYHFILFYFFLLGDFPNLVFWRSIWLAPNLHLHRRFWN